MYQNKKFEVKSMSINYSPEGIQYIVQAGDSLGNLAYEFNTSSEAILAANPGVTPNNLSVGQVLSIPAEFSTVNAEQFWGFGPRFGFGRSFPFRRFGRPFFGGPFWGYGPYWGGYGYPYWW
jgi:hypothetical protein